jgi:nucleoside-diphosphate-sugar epimerase
VAAGPWTLRGLGLVQPEMREYLHTLYQFSEPWVVDTDKFRATYGNHATPLDQAIATTLEWYRNRGAVPTH